MKQGWEIKKLVDITSHLGDGLHGTPKYTTDGDYYFINGNNLTDGIIEFKESTKRVSIDEYEKHKKTLTNRTVLVSINGTLGNVAFYNNEKIILGKSACYFNLLESVDKDFIKYILSSPYFLDYAHKEATGATIKNVSLKTMREFEIPLPPLPEQKRIVTILDEAFAAIAKAKANAEKNLKNAKELFESYLQGVFENKGDGWKKVFLKDACSVFTDGNWIESKDQSQDGIRLVQTGNIGFGFFKDKEDKSRFISEETFHRLKCTEILAGDLLVSRLPDPVGKSCIIPEINSKMITGVDCTIIRPKDNLSSEFLRYYQMSNKYLKDVQSLVSGSTRQRISRKNLGLIKIPLPTLHLQQSLVQELDTFLVEIKKIEAIYKKKLDDLEELKKSVLQKAFSGELKTATAGV